MPKIANALSVALVSTAMIVSTAHAQQGRLNPRPPTSFPRSAPASPPPSDGGTVGGQTGGAVSGDRFRGDGFRGGYRGGYRGFYGGGFYGGFGSFYGPPLGFYDPFWWGYGPYYGYPYYSYYAPRTVIVREPAVPPADYLIPPDVPPPQANWYRCSDPEGYYPYVRECNGPWEAVPAAPPNPPRN